MIFSSAPWVCAEVEIASIIYAWIEMKWNDCIRKNE
jgi:hypothetical protein